MKNTFVKIPSLQYICELFLANNAEFGSSSQLE